MKQLTIKDFQRKLDTKYPNESLEALTYIDMKSPAKVKCKNCGIEVELKSAQNFFLSSKKRVCPKCFPNKRDQLAAAKDKFIEFLKHQDLMMKRELEILLRIVMC